jgi:hypothetical protein
MVYYLYACGLLNIYNFTSVLNNYQQHIYGIIARDDNMVKDDAKKCQQALRLCLCRLGLAA